MRKIQYGYKIENGILTVDGKESAYVKEIFKLYAETGSLKAVKEYLNGNTVKYDGDKVGWDNIRISRILTCEKYIGKDLFPVILDKELFYRVQSKRNKIEIQPLSDDVKELKGFVYCGKCGNKMHRTNYWHRREKWVCNNGCKIEKNCGDNEILTATEKIIIKVKEDNNLLKVDNVGKGKRLNTETEKRNYEISRELRKAEPNYEYVKRIIIENAMLKFENTKLDRSQIYTGKVLDIINNLSNGKVDINTVRKIVSRLYIAVDGTIETEFINGIKVRG